MILHLVPDEKFIDAAISSFEAIYPKGNKFLVGLKNNSRSPTHVTQNESVKIASYYSRDYFLYIGKIDQYEAVIMHYLDKPKLDILTHFPNYLNFVWISWGGDVYSKLSEWRFKLYGEKTRNLLAKARSKYILEYYIRISFVYRLFENIKIEIIFSYFQKHFKGIKFFSTVLPIEKQIIQKNFKLKATYVHFSYGVEVGYHKKENEQLGFCDEGVNILMGNSASPTNNHIEVMEILQRKKLNIRKIVMPLNYGGNRKYIEYIRKAGEEYWGNHFSPLLDFIDKIDYYNIISKCSVCIMNHYRQQGIGNVSFMILIGAKVFLSERNPAYKYFRDQGVVLFSVERDIHNNCRDDIFDPLSFKDKANNRMIIERLFGTDAIIERTRNFIYKIIGKANTVD